MIKMKMQTFIKIISFIIAILVVLSVFSVLAWKENMNTRYVLSSSYQKSIAEVAALSETLLSDMQKLEYSKSLYQFVMETGNGITVHVETDRVIFSRYTQYTFFGNGCIITRVS